MGALAASAAAGGTTISEGPSSGSDNLWHIDIGVSFDSVGMGANAVNSGAGTVRIPLTFSAPCQSGTTPDQPAAAPLPCLVPKLRGLTLAVARRKIADGGCRLGHVKRAASKKAKAGRVISQSPAPGRKLAPRAKVNV